MNTFETLLDKFNALHIAEALNFDLMNEILISHHSTAIEGSSLTEEEARVLILEGLTAKGKPMEDHLMVQDHQRALVEIITMAKMKTTLTPNLIQAINANVMKNTGSIINAMAGTFDSSKGDWRKLSVHAGARYFIDYSKVPNHVKQLCEVINNKINEIKTTKEIYDLAFDAHFSLVSIHPFADGNGRTSRLLMNYILTYHGKPLAIVFREDKIEYIKSLEKSREVENTLPFKEFMYAQQKKFLLTEIEKVQKLKEKKFLGFSSQTKGKRMKL